MHKSAPKSTTLPVPFTPAVLGTIDLTAVVVAQISDSAPSRNTAVLRLGAVDSYVGTLVKVGLDADTSAVTAVRGDIAAAETTAELTAVLSLGQAACVFTQHRPSARFTPYVDAVLLGETADFSLDVTNLGTLATSYAITVSGLPAGDLLLNEMIDPGDTAVLPVPFTHQSHL